MLYILAPILKASSTSIRSIHHISNLIYLYFYLLNFLLFEKERKEIKHIRNRIPTFKGPELKAAGPLAETEITAAFLSLLTVMIGDERG